MFYVGRESQPRPSQVFLRSTDALLRVLPDLAVRKTLPYGRLGEAANSMWDLIDKLNTLPRQERRGQSNPPRSSGKQSSALDLSNIVFVMEFP